MIAPFLAALVLGVQCPATETRDAFKRFVVAYNRGDTPTLDRLFAPSGDFAWYSSGAPGERLRGDASNRRTLMAYFRARHAQQDRLTILRFRTRDSPTTLGHFQFLLRRRALDYDGGRPFRVVGKGALSCALSPPAFVVVSLGGPGSG